MTSFPRPEIEHPHRRFSDRPQSEDDFDLAALSAGLTIDLDDRPRTIEALREVLRRGREDLETRFRGGHRASRLIRHHAHLIDTLVERIWTACLGESTGLAALVAVGGYGRAELHPRSDVDLLILIKNDRTRTRLRAHIETFVTLLWDIGLEVGHSTRTVDECLREGREDITVITSLIESRRLCGDHGLYERLCKALSPKRLWPADAFFIAKRDEQIARHHRFRDSAYGLEPNVKEGPGGLRDLQVIVWVTRRHFGSRLDELVDHGFLTAGEYDELVRCQDFLWQVRYALHLQTRRNENRLLFDLQRELADQFGYRDDEQSIAVEKFMQAYYRVITSLSRLNEMLLQLFEEAILVHDRHQETLPFNRRFRSCNGFLEVKDEAVFQRYPFALLEAFLLLQQHPELKGVRAETIRQIRHYRHLIDDDFRNDLRCRSLFLDILRQPAGATHELRRMNRYGILAAYCVPFGAIVGRMQYDLFHTYTVDEHTLMVVDNVHAFTREESKEAFPLCHQVMQRIPKREILYIAALFHDIAKGRGGNHSELGAVDARDFCRHHGLSEFDTALVAWLVHEHLVMSSTAQRRDIEDPGVIDEFARLVGDENRLNHLYLLTVADICGTNPEAWNNWKSNLMNGLYLATRRHLRHGLETPWEAADELVERREQAREALGDLPEAAIDAVWGRLDEDYFARHSVGEIVWHTRILSRHPQPDETIVTTRNDEERGISQVLTFGPDRGGLLASLAMALDRMALNIVDARIVTTSDGYALNTFVVLDAHDSGQLSDARLEEVGQALEQALTRGAPTIRLQPQPRRLRHFVIPTEILFSDDLQHRFTIVHLTTADRPGLLASIAQAFTDHETVICSARISTLGERVEDTFFITDRDGRPLIDAEQIGGLRQHVLERLEQGVDGA